MVKEYLMCSEESAEAAGHHDEPGTMVPETNDASA